LLAAAGGVGIVAAILFPDILGQFKILLGFMLGFTLLPITLLGNAEINPIIRVFLGGILTVSYILGIVSVAQGKGEF
jgi:hypothetical protein